MTHLAAIIAFILAVIFWILAIGHGVWQWELFMLLGLALWCLSAHPKAP